MGAPKGGKGSKGKGKGKGKVQDNAKGKGKGASTKGAGKGEAKKWVKVKGHVLVTGAGGYLGMNCIRQLLSKGYKVRGTVRSKDNEATCGPLKKQFPTLELYEADLLGGPEAFEKACAGCNYVLHTASPFQLAVDDPQKDLVDPALKGTESVVSAAIKAGVSRVVVTSSVAAIGPPMSWRADPTVGDKDKVFTEADWNDKCSLTDGPYLFSKYLAEKKAWELVEGTSTSLACINPSFIIGPMMSSRADGTSVRLLKSMLEGTANLDGFPLGVVDVRDIAKAHVAAMETAEAGGKRFLCSSEIGYDKQALANMLLDRFKAYPIPTNGKEFGFTPKFSHAQAADILKFKPRPVEISMRDMANAAIREGIVEKKFIVKPFVSSNIGEINPDSKRLSLLAAVISVTEVEDTKSGAKCSDVVVGDASGVVTLSLIGDEIAQAEVGSTVEVRNASVRMGKFGKAKGFIRVTVGRSGKVTKHEGDTVVTPNPAKDVSGTEYELV